MRIVASALALFGAMVAVLASILSYGSLCDENCSGRGWELSAQLWVAVVGLFVVGAMLYFVVGERWTAAKSFLIAGVILFSAWAVLLDAATHGWGHGPVPF